MMLSHVTIKFWTVLNFEVTLRTSELFADGRLWSQSFNAIWEVFKSGRRTATLLSRLFVSIILDLFLARTEAGTAGFRPLVFQIRFHGIEHCSASSADVEVVFIWKEIEFEPLSCQFGLQILCTFDS